MTFPKFLRFVLPVLLFVPAGCTTLGGGMSDEEQILVVVGEVKEALETKDLERLMATFSEDFQHPMVGGKSAARAVLGDAMSSGYMDNGRVSTENAKITMAAENMTAKVYPIDLASSRGAVAVELGLTKESTGWLVTSLDPDGV